MYICTILNSAPSWFLQRFLPPLYQFYGTSQIPDVCIFLLSDFCTFFIPVIFGLTLTDIISLHAYLTPLMQLELTDTKYLPFPDTMILQCCIPIYQVCTSLVPDFCVFLIADFCTWPFIDFCTSLTPEFCTLMRYPISAYPWYQISVPHWYQTFAPPTSYITRILQLLNRGYAPPDISFCTSMILDSYQTRFLHL